MDSVKTYLINDNGDYKLKQHHSNNKLILKNSFEDKKNQRKMAQIAKNMKTIANINMKMKKAQILKNIGSKNQNLKILRPMIKINLITCLKLF